MLIDPMKEQAWLKFKNHSSKEGLNQELLHFSMQWADGMEAAMQAANVHGLTKGMALDCLNRLPKPTEGAIVPFALVMLTNYWEYGKQLAALNLLEGV